MNKYLVLNLFMILVLTMEVNGISDRSPVSSVESAMTIIENTVIENQELEFYQEEQIVIQNNVFVNSSITIYESANILIRNNQFSNPLNFVITIFDATNITISENDFENVPESSISIFDSSEVIISNNDITLTLIDQGSLALYVAIRIERSPSSKVTSNHIKSPRGDGIHLFYSENSMIYDNLIEDTGFTAIAISSSPNTQVRNNFMLRSSQFRSNFGGNEVPESSAFSLVDSSASVIENNTIQYSDYTGIEIVSSSSVLVFRNNIIDHPTGIFIGLSSNVEVISNLFIDVVYPIEFDQASGLVTSSNEIRYENISRPNTENMNFKISIFIFVFIISLRNMKKSKIMNKSR